MLIRECLLGCEGLGGKSSETSEDFRKLVSWYVRWESGSGRCRRRGNGSVVLSIRSRECEKEDACCHFH